MKKTNNSKRTQIIKATLNITEYSKIDNMYKISTCRNRAEYVRELIFNRPIRILYRIQSLHHLIEEMMIFNNEINTITNNLSNSLEQLHRHKNDVEFKESRQGLMR